MSYTSTKIVYLLDVEQLCSYGQFEFFLGESMGLWFSGNIPGAAVLVVSENSWFAVVE